MVGIRYSTTVNCLTGAIIKTPARNIPIEYGIFDVFFLPQDRIISFVLMNPSYPVSLYSVEIIKLTNTGT